jgi:hypothetical protein
LENSRGPLGVSGLQVGNNLSADVITGPTSSSTMGRELFLGSKVPGAWC